MGVLMATGLIVGESLMRRRLRRRSWPGDKPDQRQRRSRWSSANPLAVPLSMVVFVGRHPRLLLLDEGARRRCARPADDAPAPEATYR